MNLDVHVDRRPEPRRLERHRGVQGRRPEPRPRGRRAPGRDLRRRHARQRVGLGDDPRHRRADEERQPAEQAAVHLVRRRGARPARARSTTSTTCQQAGAEPHRLRPRRRRDGDAELPHRRPRSGRPGPVRPDGDDDVPATGCTSRRQVARDQAVDYLDSIGKNHEFLSPVGTDAISFNNVGIPASGVLTGQDCCKTQEEVDLFGGVTRQLRGQHPDASTEAASTTRSAGATTSTTTTPRS